MSNPTQFPAPEVDFANDQVADLVLHKDDDAIMSNGDIVNEPDDVKEKSSAAISGSGDGDHCWFPIHFTYRGIDYSADVVRMQKAPVEYQVFEVVPAIGHLPEPFIVAEDFAKEKFDFPVNEDHYPIEFGTVVIKAINDGIHEELFIHLFEDDI